MITKKIPKNFDGSIDGAVLLLSDGIIGAMTTLTMHVRHLQGFVYENEVMAWMKIMKRLKTLDRLGLQGSIFFEFFKNVCNHSHDNLFALTQAYIKTDKYPFVRQKLHAFFEKNEKFDFQKLFMEVKLTEPECFDNPDLLLENAEEEKEVTVDLLDKLKSKFNKK